MYSSSSARIFRHNYLLVVRLRAARATALGRGAVLLLASVNILFCGVLGAALKGFPPGVGDPNVVALPAAGVCAVPNPPGVLAKDEIIGTIKTDVCT